MSGLKPVDGSYAPGYPTKLSPNQVDEILCPSLRQRFGNRVLHLGAALGSAAAMTGAAPTEATAEVITGQAPALRAPSSGDQMDQAVSKLIAKIRDPGNTGVHPHASPNPVRELASNPIIKYPRVDMYFGNSMVGLIDSGRARLATKQMFALYGINLQENVRIKGQGYEFVADGYDPATKTGFELVGSENLVQPLQPRRVKAPPARDTLDHDEIDALDADVRAGKVRMLVVRRNRLPMVDVDFHATWTYYFQAVAEYLSWIHHRP